MQLLPRVTSTQPELTTTNDDEANSYRFFHAGKICDLFNQAYHQHSLTSPNCPTRLEFDFTREQQMGVCWTESLKCTYCHFRSQKTKLYEEVNTGKRGKKPAKPNLALWTALLDNPIMGTGLQEIFHALNCPAPSTSGLQRNANKVGPMIVQMVQDDLRRERAHLKDIVEGWGYPRDTAIPVEGDGRYNNPLYWSRDRNPFQPATQASYTISENITQDKKIIGCTTRNKLCSKRNRGDNCAEHPGECAATLPYQNPIGREDQAVEGICREFLSDPEPTIISHITTDGDSTAFRGAEKAMAEQGHVVEALRDTRHLAQSQKKAADNAKFSAQMFPGRTAADRQSTKRKFSVDFMKRCPAEYDQAIWKHRGNAEKLINTLSFATDAIIDCYSGRCGTTCQQHSMVCGGVPGKQWPKEYLPPEGRTLHPTEGDEEVLRQLVNFRFSRATLTSTRYGTNTQKSEAIHRGYSKSNPKNVTCARNFQPQIFSAIHRLNHGPGKSAAIKCAALGAPVTEGTRVSCQLQRKQRKNEQDRLRKRSSKYRARRQTLVKQKFQMYFQRAETQIQAGYSKGMSNPPLPDSKETGEHSYSKKKKVTEKK